MKIETIIDYLNDKLSPVTLKELAVAGAIALTVGGGSYSYIKYSKHKEPQKQVQQVQQYTKEDIDNLNNLKARMNNLEQEIVEVKNKREEEKQNLKFGKPKIVNNYKTQSNTNQSNNQGNLYTPPIKPSYLPSSMQQQPAVEATKEIGINNPVNIQPSNMNNHGRKDGYNLVADYFPEGITVKNKTTYHTEADTDSYTITIPSLDIINTGGRPKYQTIRISLDDSTEYFTKMPHIFLIDKQNNKIDITNYFKDDIGRLNDKEINSVFISQKPALTQYLQNATKIIVDGEIMNKYEIIENETLEIIIQCCQ